MTTLEALDQLETAGFNRDQARAIVASFEQGDARLATRADLATFQAATKAELAQLEARIFRALWIQTGAIVAAVAGLLAIVERIGP